MYHVYLGLGTNLGEREANLGAALKGLEEEVRITAVSPIYETAAWGVENQPDFLNMCISGETALAPCPLLHFVKALEKEIGRKKVIHWGPRLIDIDVLLYEELIVRAHDLDVPHLGMASRATVLVPLADIAPDAVHPLSGRTVSELLAGVDKAGVRPYTG